MDTTAIFTHSKLFLSQSEEKKLDEVLSSLGFCEEWEILFDDYSLELSLCGSKKIDFTQAVNILMKILRATCEQKAKKYKLKTNKLSEYEKSFILQKYVFKKDYGHLPQWFISLY
ncbi:hypothetical protein CQA49_08140 [Helicobacter sp. MIT 00-7814]|uniref:hypothetical protein n=1 Tax=unclassified Helicobacter TaxID=2593540 RepID=UPI000E1F1DB9|nr:MULTISPECIES: hypothetical protein [unclassified Helicobacter]RDU51723.1 hypothetical protein CQA37_09415 [Helicobacter sp. MIT 99-10781]RDU52575.1 hypothetical protein CQA49_08140 [Helicobacter sp. MIT 00-7814]